MNIDITSYLDSWASYFIDCELRAKGKAKLNNDAKRKLRQYHLEQYVKGMDAAFGFMFCLRHKHQRIYKQIACANEVYKLSFQQRQKKFEEQRYGRESK